VRPPSHLCAPLHLPRRRFCARAPRGRLRGLDTARPQMNKTLFFFLVAVCVASALVQQGSPLRAPAAKVSMARATAPNMMIDTTTLDVVSQQLAASSGDFGGYTIPIIGLGTLAAIIALLAGPVED